MLRVKFPVFKTQESLFLNPIKLETWVERIEITRPKQKSNWTVPLLCLKYSKKGIELERTFEFEKSVSEKTISRIVIALAKINEKINKLFLDKNFASERSINGFKPNKFINT